MAQEGVSGYLKDKRKTKKELDRASQRKSSRKRKKPMARKKKGPAKGKVLTG